MSFLFLSLLQYHLQWDIYQQATIIITTSVDFQVNLDQMLPSWFHLLQKRTVGDSDVTIIDINIEIAIFKENQMESISEFFWSKCGSILIQYRPRGTGDQCRRSQNGFYTARVWSHRVWSLYLHESNHAECKGVYIFNSEYWGDKSKLNQNQIV